MVRCSAGGKSKLIFDLSLCFPIFVAGFPLHLSGLGGEGGCEKDVTDLGLKRRENEKFGFNCVLSRLHMIDAFRSASEDTKNAACAVLGITRKKESSTLSDKIG